MSTISNIVTIIIGIIFLLLSIVLLADISMASSNQETYEKVHHMPIADYIYDTLKQVTLLIIGFLFSVLTFFDEKRSQKWRLATHISGGVFLAFVLFSYYAWYQTGFDH